MTVTFAWYELNTFFLKFRRILVECLIKLNFQGNHYIDVFDITDTLPGFYPSTFLYSCPPSPPPKIHFFYSLLNPVFPWGIPKVNSEGKKKLKFVSLDRQKMHFQHSFWLQKHNLIFFNEYQLRIPPFCHLCLNIFFVCSRVNCWLKWRMKKDYDMPMRKYLFAFTVSWKSF